MLPGLMPVPAILAISVVGSGGTGTPIGLLLTLTKVIPTSGLTMTGTPIGLLVTLTKEIPTGSGGATAGQSAGLLLSLTRAT
jgi:hypothetical protein